MANVGRSHALSQIFETRAGLRAGSAVREAVGVYCPIRSYGALLRWGHGRRLSYSDSVRFNWVAEVLDSYLP